MDETPGFYFWLSAFGCVGVGAGPKALQQHCPVRGSTCASSYLWGLIDPKQEYPFCLGFFSNVLVPSLCNELSTHTVASKSSYLCTVGDASLLISWFLCLKKDYIQAKLSLVILLCVASILGSNLF